MGEGNESFDWRGFSFTVKFFTLCFSLGMLAHYAPLYATQYLFASEEPTPTVATEAQLASVWALSSSTSQRVINRLTIQEAVPQSGKFIAADLVAMKLKLYESGTLIAEYPIMSKGRPGTPWETPSGFYAVESKEETHFSSIGHVYMPYSMQFYGNYFIHGWTYYPDGTPVAASFSGGCIKLNTADAAAVYEFASVGTKVFVYDTRSDEAPPTLLLSRAPLPQVSAASYLVADIDTGDVYAEAGAREVRPIASLTKLMTALVANETISLDKKITLPEGSLKNPPETAGEEKTFLVNDLFYPLLMQSSNPVADSLASYYGSSRFLYWMNATAVALDMASTTFADPSGVSAENTSSAEDLFRLATYLNNKKSFVLSITHTPTKTITAVDGASYTIENVNAPALEPSFKGGKVGHTTAAEDTALSILTFSTGGYTRKVALIVLGSENQADDTNALAAWLRDAAAQMSVSACVSCALPQTYRKIEL